MIYPSTTPDGGTQLIDRLEEDSIFTDRFVGGPEGATRQLQVQTKFLDTFQFLIKP